jgi:hypothetical protein
MTFKASYDWPVKIMTASFILLYAVIIALSIRNIETITVGAIISLFVLTAVLSAYFWHPQSYKVTSGGIVIKRPIGSKLIGFSTIKQIKPIEKDDFGFIMRVFGNGGLFGYTGIHKSAVLGETTFFATQQRNYIMVETDLKKYILTPDEPVDFMKSVENKGR